MSHIYLGCHLSVSNGFQKMAEEAISLGANVFQFFSRNPRGSKAKAIDPDDAKRFNELRKAHDFGPPLAHAPYTLNPAAKEERIRDFAAMAMSDDLVRLSNFPGTMYNFHPGSHVGQGVDAGIELIAALLNQLITADNKTTILLEGMGGKGSEIGSRFEELRRIIDRTNHNEYIGVCLDTCHLYDAGYDIKSDLDGVLDEFDAVVGLSRLKAIHLNDSKNVRGSHKDRHEKIGQGELGLEAILNVMRHPKLRHLPFYLETPNEPDGYKEEIALLRAHLS
ncbi:MAG TPA: deoxyribonuclease IV [Clostridiaceae bacterium]|jgi:deoxyribonuclease-4|nr:deoxyribonuclease IV [Clostridiaceae bacterium]